MPGSISAIRLVKIYFELLSTADKVTLASTNRVHEIAVELIQCYTLMFILTYIHKIETIALSLQSDVIKEQL
jgi:hypothetical protein